MVFRLCVNTYGSSTNLAWKTVCCTSDRYTVPVSEDRTAGLLVDSSGDVAKLEPSEDQWGEEGGLEVEVESY